MSDYRHLIWTEKVRRKLIGLAGYDVYLSRRRDANGRKADFTVVEAPDWCNVVARTRREDGVPCLVMVRQYRHASDSVTLEFPGGVVDPGEPPNVAAARELEEETGYRSDELTLIGVTYPNPAIMTNRAHTFFADNAYRVGDQALDELELLDMELVPEAEIRSLARSEFHTHSIMLCALYWYELHERDGRSYEERERIWG